MAANTTLSSAVQTTETIGTSSVRLSQRNSPKEPSGPSSHQGICVCRVEAFNKVLHQSGWEALPFVVTVPVNGFTAECFVDNWRR